jgi:glyoxylase-like metal-dependent hydrolase (beta-lactamase superfamily II)
MLLETALTPRLLVLSLGGDTPITSYGANCVALAGPAATLLVDPLIAPPHARLVADALARRRLPAVTHVVVTHHHTDHALGAGWFAANGATVVAHAHCAEAMAAQHPRTVAERRRSPGLAALFAEAEAYVPSVAFEKAYRIDLGGAVVAEARHLGPGHTAGDCVVLFPSESAVACGDLVFRGYHFNYEEADLAALPLSLATLRKAPAARFIPGHGVPGGPEIVDEQARYHERVRAIVASARDRDEARVAIRAAFPGFRLQAVIESALGR